MNKCRTETCQNTTTHWTKKCNACRKRECATEGCGRVFYADGVRKHCPTCLNRLTVIRRKGA